ncbi:hypothetical protein IFM89_025527 [Coptis chinensis]|uniref:Uncharacterized protein n=1 Tax=Coptis chinensis TaxID=261450 RepID=A0A835HBC7_9MAGN|nr:hypothetical protein IFM89_025527 [Coptis chinensis]
MSEEQRSQERERERLRSRENQQRMRMAKDTTSVDQFLPIMQQHLQSEVSNLTATSTGTSTSELNLESHTDLDVDPHLNIDASNEELNSVDEGDSEFIDDMILYSSILHPTQEGIAMLPLMNLDEHLQLSSDQSHETVSVIPDIVGRIYTWNQARPITKSNGRDTVIKEIELLNEDRRKWSRNSRSSGEGSGAGPVVAEATERATRSETTLPTRNHAMEPDVTPMRATSDSQMVQTLTTGSQRRVQGVTRIQAQGVHTRFLSPRQEEIIEQQQGEQSAAPSNPRNRNSSNANAMEDRVWGNNERVSESMTRKCLEERNQFAALGDSNDELEDDISEKEDELFSDHEIDEMLRTNTLQPRVVGGVEAGVTSF